MKRTNDDTESRSESLSIIYQIKLRDFILVFFVTGISMGAVFGLRSLLFSLLGRETTANFGNSSFDGLLAGVMNVVMMPVAFALCACAAAAFSYPFFFLAVKIMSDRNGAKNNKPEG
jgi:hypothetical protein